jgi:hypothetical protein
MLPDLGNTVHFLAHNSLLEMCEFQRVVLESDRNLNEQGRRHLAVNQEYPFRLTRIHALY